MRSRALAALAALSVVSVALSPAPSAAAPLGEAFAPPSPIVAANLNLSVVLAGIALNGSERAQLLAGIDRNWTPAVTSLRLPLGINFSVHVRIADASPGFLTAYAAFLNASFANDTLSRQVWNYVGLFENTSAYMPSWAQDTPVRHADGKAAADWLASASGQFPEVGAPEGEARLLFLNVEQVLEPYYYTIDSRDLDRGHDFEYETANAWADGAGLFFQDLRAAPSHLGEFSTSGRPANFVGMPPAWSYGSTVAERTRLVRDLSTYVNDSIKALIAPSFGVTPFQAPSLTLDVTLFDATGAQTALKPGGAGAPYGINGSGDLLNASLVASALHALAPYTQFSVQTTLANRTSDALLAAAVDGNDRAQVPAMILDPFGVNEDLQGRWDVPPFPVEPGEDVTVPALIVIYGGEAWVDAKDIRGVTLQRSDGRAAGIVIAAGLAQLETRGLSETLIHETGHVLGFGHPHEIAELLANGTVETQVDWLRSSTSTPMTYLPSYVDYSFDSFDRHALWVGVAAATLAAAYEKRQGAFTRLQALGYTEENVPAAIASDEAVFGGFANQTRNLLAGGILYIEANPPYTDGGAIVMAKRAFDQAVAISDKAIATPRCCGGPAPPGFLPGPEAALALVALGVAGVAAVSLLRRRR